MALRGAVALVTVLLTVAFGAGTASAHASLVSCSIKNGQTFKVGHAPSTVVGTFAENLDKGSWMAIFEGQADHGLVTEKQHSVVNFKNPKQMILKLPKLGKEKYYLIWYTHSADDGHFAAGIVYFQVT